MNTKFTARALVGAAALMTVGLSPAFAYETGGPAAATPGGITSGPGAGAPPPGLYAFEQVFTTQDTLKGPGGNALLNPASNGYVAVQGFLFVPGWTFLGGTYDAVLVQPFIGASAGAPLPTPPTGTGLGVAGVHNTYIVPVELSWKLGGGFSILAGLGLYAPDGSINGAAGLGNVGNPWWTFQPEFKISWLSNGWNLTANIYDEINTKNSITGYTSGQVFHTDFTFTKTIGKWTVGPVAYYQGQVTNDTSSAYYSYALSATQRYNIWAVGGLIGYDWGPVSANLWAFDAVHTDANGPIPGAAAVGSGWTVYGSISYRLWAPEAPAEHTKAPLITK